MKMIISLSLAVVLFLSPVMGFAHTECLRPVKRVWSQTSTYSSSGRENIWITFSDGGSAVYKSLEQISEGQMSRLFSQALTALTSGKNLLVRYPEDGLTCPPSGRGRNDIVGMWSTNE